MSFPNTVIVLFDAGDYPYQIYRHMVSNSLIKDRGALIQSSKGEEKFENTKQKSQGECKQKIVKISSDSKFDQRDLLFIYCTASLM
jgi:hypothetical protein